MALDKKSINLKKFLSEASREELVEYIISKEEEGVQKETEEEGKFPVTIFSLELSPLEAISRYLKEYKKKSINEIAKILCKHPSAISVAYKNSSKKNFDFKQTKIIVPLSIFSENQDLSISEAISIYLVKKGMKISAISKLFNKDDRTVWTFVNRAKKKIKGGRQNEK